MGYYIKPLAGSQKAPFWKVQYVSYRKEHIKDLRNSIAIKPKKTWDIDKDRWQSLGFYKYMTLSEARIRSRQINTQQELKRQEEAFELRRKTEKLSQKRFDSFLPEEFIDEFERRFVKRRELEGVIKRATKSKAPYVWKAAQNMIVSVGIEPSDWFYSHHAIYDYFYDKKFSLSYIQAILKFVNLWGFFFCKKTGRPFLPVPNPRGYERQRLAEVYYSKTEKGRRASKPLSSECLASAKDKMKQESFNWLSLTVWFGLRPQEVDNLKDSELWRIEKRADGLSVLWVFQTKIITLPKEERWKPIPILYDEQKFALRIIEAQNFKRPLVKTVHKHLGEGIDLYGGRKAFTDLMLSRGNTLENISVWMGHSTISRTWKNYKSRTEYHL